MMRLFKIQFESLYCFSLQYFQESAAKVCARYDLIERLKLPITLFPPRFECEDLEDFLHRWRAVCTPDPIIVTGEQLMEIVIANDKVEIKGEIDIRNTHEGTASLFQSVADKLEGYMQRLSELESLQFNKKVEVHMPGQALSTYNDVMLASDCCSDVLQDHLDKGWRIIAACPQPDQRRPDYILGRFHPEKMTRTGAARG